MTDHPLDREAFRLAIKARLVARTRMGETEADMLATSILDEVVDHEGGFGGPGWDWTRAGAEDLADEELMEWAEAS